MKKKSVIHITSHRLADMIVETLTEAGIVVLAPETQPLFEMAKLNQKDDGMSEFPPNLYRVWVQGEGSPHKPPHIHIKNLQEGWEIRVFIETGKLWSVVRYGKRNRRKGFADVIKRVETWFAKPTKMSGRVGTNQDAAINEWEACN